jgi:hypothetical protein
MMSAKSVFNLSTLSFPGSAADQARFLLRTVRPFGNVDPTLANLPEILKAALEDRLNSPADLKTALRKYISDLGLNETTHLGGSLNKPLSKAGSKRALYFVIHDTSSPTLPAGSQFPGNMDQPSWKYNDLTRDTAVSDPVAHVFVNRLGESRTGHDFASAKLATKLETGRGLGYALVGRFLHTELVQPRIENSHGVDEVAPNPGFSPAQLQRLALLYVCASVRGGQWLIPAFHCVLDEAIKNGHDDPQNFVLEDWGRALGDLLGKIGEGAVAPGVQAESGSPTLVPHPGFRDLALVYAKADITYPKLKAVTLAHWALASNWGNSLLAVKLRNFANLPYREEMAGVAESVFATAVEEGDVNGAASTAPATLFRVTGDGYSSSLTPAGKKKLLTQRRSYPSLGTSTQV